MFIGEVRMAFTKFTNSESIDVKTETVQKYFKRVGKVVYEQLTNEEKEELNKELNTTK
jgi:hypothetical protein